MPKRTVKIRMHTYRTTVPHPSDPGKEIVKNAFAMRGQEIDVSDEESDRGDRLGAFVTDDDVAADDGSTIDADFDVVDLSDDELDDWFETSPTVKAVVDKADDAEDAQRLLDAERRATGDDPRVSLESKLQEIIDGE